MQLWADTANLAEIEELNEHPWVSGFTTNPTLFKQAGVADPQAHANRIVRLTDKPVSIDGPPELLWRLGAIPKTVKPFLHGRPVNLTAIVSPNQVADVCLNADDICSVFAGRIMDTGRDPQPTIDAAKRTGARVLWASTREVYNYIQAERAGCDIITMTPALIAKLSMLGKPLEQVAQDTIAQFAADRSW